MYIYLDLLQDILSYGKPKLDRTDTGTLSVFGKQLRFDLSKGRLPVLTTKKIHIKSIIYELLWFLRGDTNIKYLNKHGITIWDEWADQNGDLGPIYGKQWRQWEAQDGRYIDQITTVIHNLKTDPDSRRHLVSAWNVSDLDTMSLPPCHYSFQFYVEGGRLSCLFNMRSVDVFLGLPFNITSYALLTLMVAQQTNLLPGELIFSGGDVHLYCNHVEQAQGQLTREPYELPLIRLGHGDTYPKYIFDYDYDDFNVIGYQHHPAINAKIAV